MTNEEALEAIKSQDRNMRVRALRAAFSLAKPEGADVILAGLGDSKRRVKEVAELRAAWKTIQEGALHPAECYVAAILMCVCDKDGRVAAACKLLDGTP